MTLSGINACEAEQGRGQAPAAPRAAPQRRERTAGPFVECLVGITALRAARAGGARLVLDSGLDNVPAHRFYYRQGLLARALRFTRPIAAL